jgi:hypothetical protein
MAQFYMRTKEEAIEDGLMCAEPCEHIDCESWRIQTQEMCGHCGKRAAGSACFIEDGRLVHESCVVGLYFGQGSKSKLSRD